MSETAGPISIDLTETTPGVYSKTIHFCTTVGCSNAGTGTIEVGTIPPGDYFTFSGGGGPKTSGFVQPLGISHGAVQVVCTVVNCGQITLTYGSTTNTKTLDLLAAGGGGSGGISKGQFVQALGALAVFGGGSIGNVGPPSFESSFQVTQDGGILSHGTDPKSTESAKFEIGTDSTIAVMFSLPGGMGELDHVGLYANIAPGQTKYDSDTYIYFDKYKTPQVTVHDPNGFFNSADVKVIEKEGRKLEMVFDLNFAKIITNNDAIAEVWNNARQSTQIGIPSLITVIGPPEPELQETQKLTETLEESVNTEVPEWIKKNAGWWGQGQINDETFTNGIGFLIQNQIIDVPGLVKPNISPEKLDPLSAPVSEPETEFSPVVPNWIKNNALWWSEDKLTDNEFLTGIKYLLENEIIKVRI